MITEKAEGGKTAKTRCQSKVTILQMALLIRKFSFKVAPISADLSSDLPPYKRAMRRVLVSYLIISLMEEENGI